jgi:hypothetical protein
MTDARQSSVHMPAVIADMFGTSRSEARRVIAQGGVKVGGAVMTDVDVPRESVENQEIRLGNRRAGTYRAESAADTGTYTVTNLRCDNCGWKQYDIGRYEQYPIPKGQAVRDTDCPKCGVKGLSCRPW